MLRSLPVWRRCVPTDRALRTAGDYLVARRTFQPFAARHGSAKREGLVAQACSSAAPLAENSLAASFRPGEPLSYAKMPHHCPDDQIMEESRDAELGRHESHKRRRSDADTPSPQHWLVMVGGDWAGSTRKTPRATHAAYHPITAASMQMRGA